MYFNQILFCFQISYLTLFIYQLQVKFLVSFLNMSLIFIFCKFFQISLSIGKFQSELSYSINQN